MKEFKFTKEQFDEINLSYVKFSQDFILETENFAIKPLKINVSAREERVIMNGRIFEFELDFINEKLYVWEDSNLIYSVKMKSVSFRENECTGITTRIFIETY